MKLSHLLALRPNPMVFPSLQSEHPAFYSLNALNVPPANSIYQRVLNFHNACTNSNTTTKDDSVCTSFLSHTLFLSPSFDLQAPH